MKNIQLILVGKGGGMGGMGGGGGLGSMINKGVGGMIQMGVGIADAVNAKKAKKKMEANTPSESDSRQVAIVDMLRRKRLSQQSGSELSQYKNVINQGLTGARNAAVSMAGGNTGTLLATLSTSQNAAGDLYNNLAAQTEKNASGTMVLENAAENDVVARKLDVQMLKYNQANADYHAAKKSMKQNLLAGAGNVMAGGADALDMFAGGGGSGDNANPLTGAANQSAASSGGAVGAAAGTSGKTDEAPVSGETGQAISPALSDKLKKKPQFPTQ